MFVVIRYKTGVLCYCQIERQFYRCCYSYCQRITV